MTTRKTALFALIVALASGVGCASRSAPREPAPEAARDVAARTAQSGRDRGVEATRQVVVSEEAQSVALGEQGPKAQAAPPRPAPPPPATTGACIAGTSSIVRAHVDPRREAGERPVEGSFEQAVLPRCPEARAHALDEVTPDTYPPIMRVFTSLFGIDW
jgi:hypothetical protein